jgi:hypothetical protein
MRSASKNQPGLLSTAVIARRDVICVCFYEESRVQMLTELNSLPSSSSFMPQVCAASNLGKQILLVYHYCFISGIGI